MGDGWLISVRFALYLALAALFGLSAFALYGLRAPERANALSLRPWLVATAVLGLLLSALWVVLMASSMAGTPAWPIDHEAVGALLTGSAIGAAWKLRMVALAFTVLVAVLASTRPIALVLITISSAAALGTLAWTGHGAMDEAGIGCVHLVADLFHLLASGAWVGALLGLVLLVTGRRARAEEAHLRLTHRALHGFGSIGTVVVGTIVVTGLINGGILVGVGNVRSLPTSLYGQLLLAKLALFVAMLGLASLNRFRLTPAFEGAISAGNHPAALRSLRVSLAAESACVVLVLALVAWLGTLEPPASTM